MKKIKKSKIVDFNENELDLYEFTKEINFSKFVKICLTEYKEWQTQNKFHLPKYTDYKVFQKD